MSPIPLSLLKEFAVVYGPFISHPSLQHAFCAYGTSFQQLPSEELLLRQTEYTARARQMLIAKLDNPGMVDEGDLFASALLALCSEPGSYEFDVYVGGFLKIMKCLHSLGGDSTNDYPLGHVWPAMRDGLVDYILRHCRSDEARRNCKSSFLQVLKSSYTVKGFVNTEEKSELLAVSFTIFGPGRFFQLIEHSNAVQGLFECLQMFPDIIAGDADFQSVKSCLVQTVLGLRDSFKRASIPVGRVFDKLQCLGVLQEGCLSGITLSIYIHVN